MLKLLSRVGPYGWEITTALIAILLPFVLTYIITTWNAATAAKDKSAASTRPPTLPYMIPWLGHAVEFISDGGRVLAAGVYVELLTL